MPEFSSQSRHNNGTPGTTLNSHSPQYKQPFCAMCRNILHNVEQVLYGTLFASFKHVSRTSNVGWRDNMGMKWTTSIVPTAEARLPGQLQEMLRQQSFPWLFCLRRFTCRCSPSIGGRQHTFPGPDLRPFSWPFWKQVSSSLCSVWRRRFLSSFGVVWAVESARTRVLDRPERGSRSQASRRL